MSTSDENLVYRKELNGVTSASILSEIPGLAVDPAIIRGTSVLFEDLVYAPREVNNRRIAARRRRQRIEREKAGLFADQVAAEQLDPKVELEELDRKLRQRITASDTGVREKWVKVLTRLAAKTPAEQSKLVAAWNASEGPKDHAYFAGWLTKAENQGLAQKVTDRSDITDAAIRAQVEKLDKTWRTLKDIERSAKPDSKMNISGLRLAEEREKYQALGVEPPNYVSDKPTWEEIQNLKRIEADQKAMVSEEQRKELERSLLFPIAELKNLMQES